MKDVKLFLIAGVGAVHCTRRRRTSVPERDMSFSVSNRIARDIRRFRNHMCDSPSEIPCLAFGHRPSEGARGTPEFLLSAINRRLCDFVGGCRIVYLARMDVAVVVPNSFALLEDVHLDYVRDRIVNIG